jgi:hypothetical protein
MIGLRSSGDYKEFEKFLESAMKNLDVEAIFERYGQMGVDALAAATPFDTGATANAWSYRTEKTPKGSKLIFENDNVVDGLMVAILLQYGHGLPSGAYVEGIDYVNPAIQPIFDQISEDIRMELAGL